MSQSSPAKKHSTAHYFLEGLNEIGVEYLFSNFGTDHAPLIEEMARWDKQGRKFPATILCPHENTAMHMAAGYAMVTGKGQAVMVHVDAGTSNTAMGMHNARRCHTPLLLMAGKAPYTVRGELAGSRDNYVHFVQEPFDQGSIVRNYAKWEWTLPSGVITKEVLRRAHSVAHSDPQGPTYLMLPRETLAQEWDEAQVASFPAEQYGPARAGAAAGSDVTQIVDRLLSAKYPVLITSYAGRVNEAPATIEALALFGGIRVIEAHAAYLNINRKSPAFAGFMPGRHVVEADVGLMVDVDVPWIPKETRTNPNTWWAHVDIDIAKNDFPLWGFSTNLRIGGDANTVLQQVLVELKARATPAFKAAAAERLVAMQKEQAEREALNAKLASDKGVKDGINPHYVAAEVARHLGEDDIIVNEAVRNTLVVLNQVTRTKPGTSLGFAGGGLGCSPGMALGAKLARPKATVVQFVGDGGFYFGNPSSVYAVAQQYNTPIFTVLFDNSGWQAVKEATLRMYPEGDAKGRSSFQARLAPKMQFAKVCEAAGGHGETVTDPAEVAGAVERCIKAVRAGQAAVMHVRIPSI
jgi:acetolactate synthase-1/2/3 large subunit